MDGTESSDPPLRRDTPNWSSTVIYMLVRRIYIQQKLKTVWGSGWLVYSVPLGTIGPYTVILAHWPQPWPLGTYEDWSVSLQEGLRGVGGHYYVILPTGYLSSVRPFPRARYNMGHAVISWQDQDHVRLPRYGWPSRSHHSPSKLSLKNQVRILPQNLHSPNSGESFSEQSPLGREYRCTDQSAAN